MRLYRNEAGDVVVSVSSEDFVKAHIPMLERLARKDNRVYPMFLAGKWEQLEDMICKSYNTLDQ